MESSDQQAAHEPGPAEEAEYHLSFIAAICVRPKMYTMDGTLAEVAAFIEGYQSAMCKDDSGFRISGQWQRFFSWAGQKIGTSEHCRVRLLFETLRQQCPDEAKAFQMLMDFCEEYHKTQEPFLY